MTTAWRELGEKRRLRRPSGGAEPAEILPEEMAIGVALDGADLAETRRSPLTLVDSVLRRCDLSAAVWQAVTMRQVELLDCRALGLRLSVDLGQDVYVAGGRLDSATLRISRVRGLVVFDGCTFTEAMIGGDLSAVVFTGCTFEAPSSPRPRLPAATCASPASAAPAAWPPSAAPASPPTRHSPSPPASPPSWASRSKRTDHDWCGGGGVARRGVGAGHRRATANAGRHQPAPRCRSDRPARPCRSA